MVKFAQNCPKMPNPTKTCKKQPNITYFYLKQPNQDIEFLAIVIFVETDATMSKIIPINNSPTIPLDHPYVHACWVLSYNAFWCYDRLHAAEVLYAKNAIWNILSKPSVDQNFIKIIERLLLSYKTVRNDNSRWIDLPSLWFNPEFPDGISSYDDFYKSVREKRKVVKGYYKGIKVFASHLLRYMVCPSDKILKSCSTKLLSLREYDLIQLWNNTIVQLLINPQ